MTVKNQRGIHLDKKRREFLGNCLQIASVFALGVKWVFPNAARAEALSWIKIPDQHWNVGEPIYLDLSEYVVGTDLGNLVLRLDVALPPGVIRNGTIISGVPTGDFPTTQYTVTADDGGAGPAQPESPSNVTVS